MPSPLLVAAPAMPATSVPCLSLLMSAGAVAATQPGGVAVQSAPWDCTRPARSSWAEAMPLSTMAIFGVAATGGYEPGEMLQPPAAGVVSIAPRLLFADRVAFRGGGGGGRNREGGSS